MDSLNLYSSDVMDVIHLPSVVVADLSGYSHYTSGDILYHDIDATLVIEPEIDSFPKKRSFDAVDGMHYVNPDISRKKRAFNNEILSYSTSSTSAVSAFRASIAQKSRRPQQQLEVDEDEEQQQPKWQRIIFPKILKRDIRRQYGQMYLNVINSAEISLLMKFFTQFCSPSCLLARYQQEKNGEIHYMRDIPKVFGRDSIIFYLATALESFPDLVCQGIEPCGIQIRQRITTPGRSEIIIRAKVQGTKLYDLDMVKIQQLLAAKQQQREQEMMTSIRATVTAMTAGRGKKKEKKKPSSKLPLMMTTADQLVSSSALVPAAIAAASSATAASAIMMTAASVSIMQQVSSGAPKATPPSTTSKKLTKQQQSAVAIAATTTADQRRMNNNINENHVLTAAAQLLTDDNHKILLQEPLQITSTAEIIFHVNETLVIDRMEIIRLGIF